MGDTEKLLALERELEHAWGAALIYVIEQVLLSYIRFSK